MTIWLYDAPGTRLRGGVMDLGTEGYVTSSHLKTWCVEFFLDASSHLYKRVCPSVGPSVRPSVGPSVRRSVGHTRVEIMKKCRF